MVQFMFRDSVNFRDSEIVEIQHVFETKLRILYSPHLHLCIGDIRIVTVFNFTPDRTEKVL